MATLTDLVRSRRESGQGVLHSLGVSLRDKIREKFDPRRFLNQSGLLVALFPKLKTFVAKPESKLSSDKIVPDVPLTGIVLENISQDTSIAAKNSLVLPAIHRDINVMRQNVVKLVKLEGATPRLKADAWFKKSKNREMEYETKITKKSEVIKKPKEKITKSKTKTSVFKKMMTLGGIGLGLAFFSGKASASMGVTGTSWFTPSSSSSGGMGRADSGSEQQAMDFFMSRGWTKEQSAGIVGNLIAESNLKTNIPGDGGKAYGIAQWHPDRQERFRRVYGKDIRESSFEEQLAFVDWELKNDEVKSGNLLRMSSDAGQAAAIVDQHYERSSGEHRQKRINTAVRLSESSTQTEYALNTVDRTTRPGATTPKTQTSQTKIAGETLSQISSDLSRLEELSKPRDKDIIINNTEVRQSDSVQGTTQNNSMYEQSAQFALSRIL